MVQYHNRQSNIHSRIFQKNVHLFIYLDAKYELLVSSMSSHHFNVYAWIYISNDGDNAVNYACLLIRRLDGRTNGRALSA